jgi:hypothetical protein
METNSSNTERHLPLNRARRHFLGVVLSASAKLAAISAVATTIPTFPAQAMGNRWWRKGRGNNDSGPKGSGDDNCFLRGTSIMTPTGEARIEDLQIGDLVETVRGEALAVKWIGRRCCHLV